MQLNEPASGGLLKARATRGKKWQKGWFQIGLVSFLTLSLVFLTPGSLLEKLFFINGGICAQRSAHSSFFQGQQLPLETRMIGIFAAFILTLGFLWFIGRGRVLRLPEAKFTIILVLLVGPVLVDGLNATAFDLGVFYLYPPQLFLRLVSGTLGGIGIGVLIQPFFNLVVWRYAYPGSSIRGWGELAILLAIGIGLILATLSGWEGFFWPLALLAVAGVFFLMVMLNLMIFLILARRQNRVSTVLELFSLASVTFLFTIVEMGLFALFRLNLMGVTGL